jgi:hypothetical protein
MYGARSPQLQAYIGEVTRIRLQTDHDSVMDRQGDAACLIASGGLSTLSPSRGSAGVALATPNGGPASGINASSRR